MRVLAATTEGVESAVEARYRDHVERPHGLAGRSSTAPTGRKRFGNYTPAEAVNTLLEQHQSGVAPLP
jgi:hypothetical protein